MLAVFERPPEAVGETINSAVVIATEKASAYKGLRRAVDYFGPLTEVTTGNGFTTMNGPYEFAVGAKMLVRGDFSKERGKQVMQQSTLVEVEKGTIVSFTFITGSADELEGLIGNLRFNPVKSKP